MAGDAALNARNITMFYTITMQWEDAGTQIDTVTGEYDSKSLGQDRYDDLVDEFQTALSIAKTTAMICIFYRVEDGRIQLT